MNTTTWALPYGTDAQAVVLAGCSSPWVESHRITLTTSGNTVNAQGNLSAVPVVLGVPFEAVYALSEIKVRQQNAQGGEKSLADVRLQLHTCTLVLDRTAYLNVTVTPRYRDTYEYPFPAKTLGQYSLGALELKSGEHRFPVMARNSPAVVRSPSVAASARPWYCARCAGSLPKVSVR